MSKVLSCIAGLILIFSMSLVHAQEKTFPKIKYLKIYTFELDGKKLEFTTYYDELTEDATADLGIGMK